MANIPSELGDYTLLEVLHETEDTLTFVANQRAIDRTVALVALKPHRCEDEAAVRTFRDEIKAKARVAHPRIAAVFEASSQDGLVFYTREMVDGKDVVSLREEGARFELPFVWELLKVLCDSFLYYEKQELGYRPFAAEGLVLIHDEPYLANLATAEPTEATAFAESLDEIRRHFWRLLRAEDTHHPDVRQFFARMDPDHERVFQDWQDLQRACNIAAQVTSTSPSSTLETAGSGKGLAQLEGKELREASLEAARANSRLTRVFILLLIVLGGVLGWWWYHNSRPVLPIANPMIKIAGGKFVYGQGEEREVDDFVISKYEITIAQYAEFIKEAQATTVYNHVDQPSSKADHLPGDWQNLYAAALARGVYKGQGIDINCPVMGVDWWDAYAYARWRGGRLPSAEEWERAARGAMGALYPWGMEPDPNKANTGIDYAATPAEGGKVDGFNGWAPVNKLDKDVSVDGLVGMAGNVSEWTATTVADPNQPGVEMAWVKGASFMTKEPGDLSTSLARSPDKASVDRGFRIAADGLQ